jgi:hypothetical protein
MSAALAPRTPGSFANSKEGAAFYFALPTSR